MLIERLKSKIHRATVTGADLNYEGSITIPVNLMQASGLYEYEKVHVLDINNGSRFETYVIKGGENDRQIIVNGAASRLVHKGDLVIILSYAHYTEEEIKNQKPQIVIVDENNNIKR